MIGSSRHRITKTINLIGLISDTHGLVRPEALVALQGVDLIIHAGDIGNREVLDALKPIAPIRAIKGNNDRGRWAMKLPDTKTISMSGAKLFLIHDIHDLAFEPSQRGIAVVISGHSHKPSVTTRGGVLFVNPGSAGPRRFKLPVAIGRLRLKKSTITAEIIELAV